MNKLMLKIIASATIGSALVAAVPAEARHGGNRGTYNSHRGWNGGGRSNWSHRGGGDYARYGRHWNSSRGYGNRGYGNRDYWRYGNSGYRGYWGHPGYYRYHDDDDAALAVGAGILGVAIGSAIASDGDRDYRYDDRYRYEGGGTYDSYDEGY